MTILARGVLPLTTFALATSGLLIATAHRSTFGTTFYPSWWFGGIELVLLGGLSALAFLDAMSTLVEALNGRWRSAALDLGAALLAGVAVPAMLFIDPMTLIYAT